MTQQEAKWSAILRRKKIKKAANQRLAAIVALPVQFSNHFFHDLLIINKLQII
jgi:hypothetical protein